MLMRHAHEYEAKPRGGLAKRIVAVLASVAMLGGMGYATTSAALAEDTPTTVETTTDQSVTTANETTGDGNATDNVTMRAILPSTLRALNPIPTLVRIPA